MESMGIKTETKIRESIEYGKLIISEEEKENWCIIPFQFKIDLIS